MFSEVAEIARVAARLRQFQQLLKTQVILILDFTRPHAITHTNSVRLYVTCYIILSLRPKLSHSFSLQFENLLTDNKMKILLDEPLTSNDSKFLQSLYVAALPNQHSIDFTKVKKAEIHGCGFILKLLDGEYGSIKYNI